MTARDIVYGRQGGRVEKWKKPEPGECRATATVQCDCGRWQVARRAVGQPCWSCGQRLVLVAEIVEEPLTPAALAEQEAGLARARRALGAA